MTDAEFSALDQQRSEGCCGVCSPCEGMIRDAFAEARRARASEAKLRKALEHVRDLAFGEPEFVDIFDIAIAAQDAVDLTK